MVEENKQEEQAPAQTVGEAPKTKAHDDEKWLSIIAYASIGFVLPVILKPENKTCQFHAKQGLGMFALSIMVLFVLAVPSTLFSMIGTLLFLGFFGVTVLAMFQASQGKEWKIPVLGDIVAKIDLSKMIAGTPAQAPKETTTPTETPKTEETPVETPVVKTPKVEETPVVEAAPVETPAVETPKVEETPVVEAAPVETPVVETPKVEETPVAPETPKEKPQQ